MKMSKIVALVLVVVSLLSCFVGCKKDNREEIIVWVSEIEGSVELAQQQIDRFMAANPDFEELYKFKIEGVSEADAASQVLADVQSAPDLYCFAQDQLARLVQASALLAPGQAASATIKADNDAISVSAASVAGTLYAYPMTSDNGYYMYYDKSVITNPDSLEQIVADCEKAGLKFGFELENAWYTASFFIGVGCKSNWTMNEDGEFTSIEDNWNSDLGLIAMRGMEKVTKSTSYVSTSSEFNGSAAIVTGIWNANTATEYYGENLGVADLPSFEVDGTSYHLGSFSGNKLMGVKPQADAAKGAFLSKLAQYLTSEECQLERYNKFQWGPSNLKAQGNADVKANVSLGALAAQSAHAIPQGNIHGSWWDIAKVLGAEAKNAASVDDLKKALVTYQGAIDALFEMTEEQKQAWSVIGSLKESGWNVDYPMTKVSEGVYESEVLEFVAGDEFKVRQGASWTMNFGADGKVDGSNFVVEAAGNYKVRLTIISETEGKLELVPAN